MGYFSELHATLSRIPDPEPTPEDMPSRQSRDILRLERRSPGELMEEAPRAPLDASTRIQLLRSIFGSDIE